MGYYVRVERDVRIYVEDLNPDGEKTILFIHGWPANNKIFEYQYNELACQRIRCVGIDTRGFGKSDKPLCGYNWDRLADDVRCVIDELELHDITLLGHSNGGAMAVRYMARHNNHGIAKLVLADAAAPSIIQRPNFPFGLRKEDVVKLIQQTYTDRPKMLQEFGDMFFFQYLTKPFSDWFFHLGLEAAGWATAEMAKTWIREPLFADLAKIRVPTLIVQGVHDKVVLFPLAEALHQGIRNSMLIPFRYSGHATFYDERDKFNHEVLRFVTM